MEAKILVDVLVNYSLASLQESLRLSRMTRFYIKEKEDPHGPHIAIYVSCLPTSLSQRQYEHILLDMIGRGQCLCHVVVVVVVVVAAAAAVGSSYSCSSCSCSSCSGNRTLEDNEISMKHK